MNLALINPRVWAEIIVLLILVGLGWYAYNEIYDRGAQSVQVKWDAEKLAIASQTIKIQADAKAKSDKLQSDFAELQRQKDEQISSVNRALATAIAGLSNRPARDSEGRVPVDPATGSAIGGTGATLLRQDGEFLVRESSRADRLRLQLIDCQAKYGKARDALN